jgi:ABC-type nitrate/sulfonate/bicarbonate transport system substrate-binding protein
MKPLRVLPACLAVLALSATLHAAPLAAQAPDSPDLAEARKYTLTMDKVQKLVAAFDAVNKLTAANPALKAKMDADSGPNLNLDQRAKNIDANFPQVAAAIHAQGLTTREFIVVSIAFINDVSFVGMKKSGMIKDYPPNSVTPENAAFVEANFDKLQQLSQKLSQTQN